MHIFDDNDQIDTVKKAMKDLDIDPKSFAPRNILSRISNSKCQLIDYEQFVKQKGNYYDEVVGRVFENYENTLSQSNAADFDDLLMKTHDLFFIRICSLFVYSCCICSLFVYSCMCARASFL